MHSRTVQLTEKSFKLAKKLNYLKIANTELYSIAGPIFEKSSNLKWLDLRGNKITFFTEDTFKGLNKLTTLMLSQNRLKSYLTEGLFKNLPLLEKLDLSGNRLLWLEKNIFKHNFYLKDLDVSYNYIQIVDSSIFDSLQHERINVNFVENRCLNRDYLMTEISVISRDLLMNCNPNVSTEMANTIQQIENVSDEINELNETVMACQSNTDLYILSEDDCQFSLENFRATLNNCQRSEKSIKLKSCEKSVKLLKDEISSYFEIDFEGKSCRKLNLNFWDSTNNLEILNQDSCLETKNTVDDISSYIDQSFQDLFELSKDSDQELLTQSLSDCEFSQHDCDKKLEDLRYEENTWKQKCLPTNNID